MHVTTQEAQNYLKEQNLWDVLQNTPENQLPADWRDLARLHSLSRSRKAFCVLEFGVGRSTIVLADALRQNKTAWDALPEKPNLRRSTPFTVFSVDGSESWIESAKKRIPAALQAHAEFLHTKVESGTFQGRACHFFEIVPDVVPDFIYLDAPDPQDVEGNIRGLSWNSADRTVMAADILLLEPTLLPGTFVLVDGRTNNARFLEHNLQRKWEVVHHVKEDITTMELVEAPLGESNHAQLVYCLGEDALNKYV